MKISGTTAVITGASSGIGADTAHALARAGARVVLLARTRAALDEVAANVRTAGGAADVYPCDLTDPVAVNQTAEAILADVGVPDLLVHSAGAGRWLAIEETDPDEAVQMMAVPYFATFFVTRAFIPAMLRRNRGHIVVMNSPAAFCPWPGSIGYAAARAALRGFTEALRADLYFSGINVTSIIATEVSSSYWQRNPGAADRRPTIGRLIPTLTPAQVAAGIVRAIERDTGELVMPRMAAAFLLLHRLAPDVLPWLLARTGWRRAPLR